MRFMDSEYAEFYHKRQVRAGYPGLLLPLILREAEGCRTVIDIGAGTGFFSIPLAEKGMKVTAIEPSPAMSSIMVRECPDNQKQNINVYTGGWEDWPGEKHHMSICIHSIYALSSIRKALMKMKKFSDKGIVIVRDSRNMITLSGLVRAELGIKADTDRNPEIEDILKSSDMPFTTETVRDERKTVWTSLHDEAANLAHQLKTGDESVSSIEKIIEDASAYSDGKYTFTSLFTDRAYIF